MVVLFLVFQGISILSSIVAISIYQHTFPPTVQEGSLFSTPSPAFIVCRFFYDGHSDLCEVISHCSFDLHFSNLESPLNCKKIQPVHSKGDRSWVFLGRNDAKGETPVLWPPHAKS